MRRPCAIGLVVLAMFVVSGCGQSGPKTMTVSGSVTLDGEPIDAGRIIFRDAEGKVKSYGDKITGGKYSFESAPGSKRVEIRAMREVPGEMDESNPGEPVPAMEQYVPEQYNTETTLEAEVTESGDNEFDFPLTSGDY